jgi:hypothetical protein
MRSDALAKVLEALKGFDAQQLQSVIQSAVEQLAMRAPTADATPSSSKIYQCEHESDEDALARVEDGLDRRACK